MRNLFTLYAIMCSFFLASLVGCDSNNVVEFPKPKETLEVQAKKAKLDYLAQTFAQLSDDLDLMREVKGGVDLRYDGDENILFKDMLTTPNSIYKKSTSILQNKLFTTLKNNELNKTNTTMLNADSLFQWALDQNVEIYWPYSQGWDDKTAPTISFHPLIEDASENKGYKKVKLANGREKIEEVIVNDEYAINNPVWIIRPSEETPEAIEYFRSAVPQKNKDKLLSKSSATQYLHVKIGWVKLRTHHDGLFEGGSDLRFGRAGAVLKLGDKIEPDFPAFSYKISRWDIRWRVWKKVYATWDFNWSENEVKQSLIIWEEDNNQEEKTFTGNITITTEEGTTTDNKTGENTTKKTITNKGNGVWGFAWKEPGVDVTLFQQDWERAAYLNQNQRDQGFGFRDVKGNNVPVTSGGFPVFSTGDLLFTIPWSN